MRIRVKICGINSAEALDAAIDAGADAVGFVFARSPRQVTVDTAAALGARMPAFVTPVAVTRQPDAGFFSNILTKLGFPCWQTDIEDIDGVSLPSWCRPLPVLREGSVDAVRLPTQFVYEGQASGAGIPVDWNAAEGLARRGRMVLAGGLNAANVGAAIRHVRPWAVDVSSGVERAPGVKDAARIRDFVSAVRAAENALNEEF